MFRFLKKNSESWTRNLLVKKIASDINLPNLNVDKDKLVLVTSDGWSVTSNFISNNYADSSHIELNASIVFEKNDRSIEWLDLFHLTKAMLIKWHQPLQIKKREVWEGSNMQKDTLAIYAPLMRVLSDPKLRHEFLNGSSLDEVPLKLKEEWLIEKSKEVANFTEVAN